MSAVNPNSGDREVEALRRAQRAHEPSMDEILASIRNMIVDEREPDKTAPARAVPVRFPPSAPQIVYSKGDPGSQPAAADVVRASAPEGRLSPELNQAAAPSPEARPPQEPKRAKGERPRPELLDPAPADFASSAGEEPLMSPEAGQAVTSAFEALSVNLAAHGAEIAQTMAREMLRPMLKTWLDENLPGIVERLVRAEIERVARGIR